MKQPQLPGIERPPRRRPRVMAKVWDAGGEVGKWVVYRCASCDWKSDWMDETQKSDSEIRRGFPCPICNKSTPHLKPENAQ